MTPTKTSSTFSTPPGCSSACRVCATPWGGRRSTRTSCCRCCSPTTRRYYQDGAILVGAAPEYIQSEHEPSCEACGARMRFLFQFADVTDDFMLGDAGVGYVYGCDAHPERLQGFIDCC